MESIHKVLLRLMLVLSLLGTTVATPSTVFAPVYNTEFVVKAKELEATVVK